MSRPATTKIFPRNLTARAAVAVAGNPVSSRLETTVGNCYPGLEMHVRSLDARFFPGLLLVFPDLRDNPPATQDPQREGAKLVYVDNADPAIYPPRADDPLALALYDDLLGGGGKAAILSEGTWFLDAVEQGGKTIRMYRSARDKDGQRVELPLGGLYVWRIVRSLAPAPVTITLVRRDTPAEPVVLHGWRRRYTDPSTGVLDLAYSPGELGASLCSPWTHDFRDCACHYWSANHPDIVHGAISPSGKTLPDGEAADPIVSHTPVDWLRRDRTPAGAVAAAATIDENRPFQLDHYEINRRWQELGFVLQNYEIGETYQPVARDPDPEPFAGPRELAACLRDELAPLELALALEYLYARWSLKAPDEVPADAWPTMRGDITAIRHYLVLVAAGEMMHLRYANQLLWALHRSFPELGPYEPVLTPAARIPIGRTPQGEVNWRPRALRRLTHETLDDFIRIEEPSGLIEGAYARVVATLRGPDYPPHLADLAIRVDTDGVEHFANFHYAKRILRAYAGAVPEHPYLRRVEPGSAASAAPALTVFHRIVDGLGQAFRSFGDSDYRSAGREVDSARESMRELDRVADALAAQGVGVPFWDERVE